jgi:ABC-type uncharacterized transport system ATPase subunit
MGLSHFQQYFSYIGLSVTCDRLLVSLDTPVSATNETDRHDIAEILLKVTQTHDLAHLGLIPN